MEKQTIRERVWTDLEESGVARFPFPPHGRIPNFENAKGAAERLAAQPEWQAAEAIKANPDAPQLPVRRRALREGKTVYMAVPRLKDEQCFLKLDPAALEDFDEATTVSGSSKHGVPVGPDEMDELDLIVSGSVAVNAQGARIGKGEGYSDLEFAVLREQGLVDDDTTTVTTVHERQCLEEALSTTPQDVPMDWVITPERAIRTAASDRKPTGIAWELLSDDRIAEIPILQRLKRCDS